MTHPIITRLQERYETLSNRDRVFLLLIGWILIYGCWYYLYAKSDIEQRTNMTLKYQAIKDDITAAKMDIVNVIRSAKKEEIELSSQPVPTNESKIFLKDSPDRIIKQFFNLENDIKSISLKSSAISPTSYGLQIQFNSSYFATMDYLGRLEKLPWCLSWDSLIYRVGVHPDATVNLTLHTVGAA